MSHEQDTLNQLYLFLKKISMPTFYILLGIMANYTDHYRKGTLNKKQVIISGIFGISAGYSAFEACLALNLLRHAGYIVPVITVAGEKIFPYIIEKTTTFLDKIVKFLEAYTTKNKKESNEPPSVN